MSVVFTIIGATALLAVLGCGVMFLIKNVSLKGKDSE